MKMVESSMVIFTEHTYRISKIRFKMANLTHEDVNGICVKALEAKIGSSSYEHMEAVRWNQEVVEVI
jgi:hypothetical protein